MGGTDGELVTNLQTLGSDQDIEVAHIKVLRMAMACVSALLLTQGDRYFC